MKRPKTILQMIGQAIIFSISTLVFFSVLAFVITIASVPADLLRQHVGLPICGNSQ